MQYINFLHSNSVNNPGYFVLESVVLLDQAIKFQALDLNFLPTSEIYGSLKWSKKHAPLSFLPRYSCCHTGKQNVHIHHTEVKVKAAIPTLARSLHDLFTHSNLLHLIANIERHTCSKCCFLNSWGIFSKHLLSSSPLLSQGNMKNVGNNPEHTASRGLGSVEPSRTSDFGSCYRENNLTRR